MAKYEVKCTDVDGDVLKVDITENGLANASIDADKFSIVIDSEKIKRLVDSINGIQHLLEDFGFKKFEIESIEE